MSTVMRTVWWLSAIGFAAGCGAEQPKTVTPAVVDGWELRANAPALSGTSVSGGFVAMGDGMRAFGACLLADVHGQKACSTEADCATGALVSLAGAADYCVPAQGESTSRCWTRGSDAEWCNKVPPPGRVAGSYSTPAVELSVVAGSGAKTRWMTIACLNAGTYPMFSDGPLPPCASGDPAAESYNGHALSAVSTYAAP